MMYYPRSKHKRFTHAYRIVLYLTVSLALMACGVDNSGGGGGSGGSSNKTSNGGGGGISVNESDAVDDTRWNAPDGIEQVIALPSNAVACTINSQCPTGYCVDGFCCDSKCDNKCMACSVAKKGSGVDGLCGSIKYDTDPDNDCPSGACDGKNMCKNYNGAACTSAPQCLSTYCVDGYCCGNICMGACQACSAVKKGGGIDGACGNIAVNADPDNECTGSQCNGSGACQTAQATAPNGTICTSAPQCASGYCADGVCCDSWCLGNCQACTAAKKGSGNDGTCGNIINDKDPDEECWGGSCDGKSVCKQYNGVPCSDKSQCLSNYCVDGFCCGNICTGMCYACSEAKKGQGYDGACGPMASGKDPENECNPGECNGSGTCNQPQTPQANGTTCVSGGQCASANCVDGYCCNTACTGTCLACSATKKGSGANGTCGPIASETNPDNECNGGKCDGTGACRYYNGASCTATNQCFSNYCVDGVCCGNVCTSLCYACSATKKGQGANGACGPIANTRDPDNECNPGECNGSGTCNQPQTPQANGAACTLATQCASGKCVEGYCCDTACTETCKACSAAKKGSGTNGTCGNVKYDTDPDNECAGGACSGSGTCQSYNGVACTQTSQCLSNYCVDGVCCGNICNGPCMACTAAKKGSSYDGSCGTIANNSDPDNECASTCNGMGVCNAAPNAATCSSAADCISGLCADGYCCNTACAGVCEACSVVGSEGTCSNACPGPCTGTVGLPIAPFSPNMYVTGSLLSIDSADFNADNKVDVVAVNPQGVNFSAGISIFMGQGNGAFSAQLDLASAADPASVAATDLNGDGRPDIVSASINGGGVSVFLNQGNGTFAPRVDYATVWGGDPYFDAPDLLAIADLDGDGILDLATANYYGSLTLLMGQGNGTFGSAVNLGGFTYPRAIATGDFNADGKVDLAVTNSDGSVGEPGRVTIALSLGNGAFAAGVHYPLASKSNSITAADLNGDGKLDIATSSFVSSSGSKLNVLLNLGNGTFGSAVTYDVSGANSVIAANVNGDANVDLVATTGSNNTVQVLLGQGNGTFAAGVDYLVRADAFAVVAADIDNDTDKDLVVAAGGRHALASAGTLAVLKNPGNGVFGPTIDPSPKVAMNASVIQTADLDSDGKLDLVGAANDGIRVAFGQGNGQFGAITLYSATTTEHPYMAAIGDMNGDGKPDLVVNNGLHEQKISVRLNQGNGIFGTKTDYATDFNSGGLVLGDFNADGSLDVATSGFSSYLTNPQQQTYSHSVWARVMYNDGSGTLGSSNTYPAGLGDAGALAPDTRSPIVAGDLNGDGKLDLAVSEYSLNGAVFLINSGNGQFSAAGGVTMGYFSTGYLVAADFTGDNKVDLAMASDYGDLIRVWFNNGAGAFSAGGDYSRTGTAGQPIAVDINGDNKVDLAFPDGASHVVGVLLNQGSGIFGSRLDYVAGFGANWLAAGDINNDGRMDLGVANPKSNSISILRGVCLP